MFYLDIHNVSCVCLWYSLALSYLRTAWHCCGWINIIFFYWPLMNLICTCLFSQFTLMYDKLHWSQVQLKCLWFPPKCRPAVACLWTSTLLWWHGLVWARIFQVQLQNSISCWSFSQQFLRMPGSTRCPGKRSFYNGQKIYLTGWLLIMLTFLISFQNLHPCSAWMGVSNIWRDILWCLCI